ncbi:MAG: hypothetical protein K1X83_08335 [Oligoflexia bacterium]|nr:hypothetical protein [Oligoflexia bacterium]
MNKAPQGKGTGSQGYSPESWEEARRIASQIGPVPSSFTSCIHFLKKDFEATGLMGPRSKFALNRLLRSDIFRAPMYYGTCTFFHEEMEHYEHVDAPVFAELMGLDGVIVATSLLYLYKRLKRNSDQTEWAHLAKNILLDAELGGHLGRAIPAIGFTLGLMVGGIRQVSLGTFLGVDKKNFTAYRRKTKGAFDMTTEVAHWGCNHAQVGSLLLQAVGMGVSQVDGLITGLDPSITNADSLAPDALKVRLVSIWIEALRTTGAPPDMVHNSKYYPLKKDLDRLLAKVEETRLHGTAFGWLERGKEDVTPEKTPQLYSAFELKRALADIAQKADGVATATSNSEEEIPDEVLEEMTAEEIAKLESEELT